MTDSGGLAEACLGTLARGSHYRHPLTDIRIGPFGPFPWIDLILLGRFALVAVSVAYVAWDAYRKDPELTVMKWGWVLVTLYMAPVGLTLYVPREGAISWHA